METKYKPRRTSGSMTAPQAVRYAVIDFYWFTDTIERDDGKGIMAYSKKVLEHYQNPRNVGSFKKDEENIGTGVVGAPECGDVMKLQIKIAPYEHTCNSCHHRFVSNTQEATCRQCGGISLNVREEIIEDARFKTFGCGSAIASSSYVTELVKGKTLGEVEKIKNVQIVEELSLPPVKIHCSVLAEDAIKAAIEDWRKKTLLSQPSPSKSVSAGGDLR